MEATVLCCFSWVWSSMPKVLWSNKYQYLWKGLSDFADVLQVVICILWDIHYFELALSGMASEPIRLSDVAPSHFAGFFTCGLFDLLNVIPRVHCFILLVRIYFTKNTKRFSKISNFSSFIWQITWCVVLVKVQELSRTCSPVRKGPKTTPKSIYL